MADLFTVLSLIAVGVVFVVFVAGALSTPQAMQIPSGQQTTRLPAFFNFLSLLGIPDNWLYLPAIIFYFVIPLIGIWLIIYGFMDRIHIFRENWINGALSFTIAFSTIPMGAFVSAVAFMFGFLGVYSVLVFSVLMVIGIGALGGAVWKGWRGGMLERELGIYDLELDKERKKKQVYEDQLKNIKERFDALADQIKKDVKNGKMEPPEAQKRLDALRRQFAPHLSGLESKIREVEISIRGIKKEKGEKKKEVKKEEKVLKGG